MRGFKSSFTNYSYTERLCAIQRDCVLYREMCGIQRDCVLYRETVCFTGFVRLNCNFYIFRSFHFQLAFLYLTIRRIVTIEC